MSEENKVESETGEPEPGSTDIVEADVAESKTGEPEPGSTDIVEEEVVDEDSVVLSYPDRVPNSKRGVDHKHSYVMIGLVVAFLLFSLIVSNFTASY
jgi:hypothetical protein